MRHPGGSPFRKSLSQRTMELQRQYAMAAEFRRRREAEAERLRQQRAGQGQIVPSDREFERGSHFRSYLFWFVIAVVLLLGIIMLTKIDIGQWQPSQGLNTIVRSSSVFMSTARS